jgi:D-alanyl-D-alanine carboxypeptidase/D-alanyl-D-alanine-endopeptidase (penicillin-binding protein 4)
MRALRTTAALLLAGCAGARTMPPAPTGSAPAHPAVAHPSEPSRDERAGLRAFVDSATGAPEFRSAQWGILGVDPVSGDTLVSRNADKLFVPASNMKLVTTAVGLAQLGPTFRWSTTLLARGPVRDGVLDGDLVVRGEGDPSFSTHLHGDALAPLRDLADSVRAHGITRVRGRVLAAPSPFPDAPLGYGWEWEDLDEPYGAGVDALYFNEGFTDVVVTAGARAGDAPRAATRPASRYPALDVRAATVARVATPTDSTAGRTRLTVAWDSSGTRVLVGGTIAVGDSVVLQLAFRDQTAAFLAAFAEALAARGVRVDGARRDGSARADSIVALASPTLAEVLPYLAKPSQNQIAELLFKTLGQRATGVGSADSAAAIVSRQLLAWGAQPDGFAVHDGSGLSRHDFVSPRTLVRVLDAMRRRPDFRAYYDALPVAGVDGTLEKRMRGTPAEGNVHAKTGYVDKARSLSGYVTTADGRMLLFSALCNNYVVPTRAVERVQDALAARLAALRLPQA